MFADYNALREAVIRWADNDDVTPRVDDLISLAHDRLNRVLRLEGMTTVLLTPATPNSKWTPKPEGYMGMRNLGLTAYPGQDLTYRSLSQMAKDTGLNQPGTPSVYSVAGSNIRLGPIPQGEVELEVIYWQRVPTLSAQVATNVFLTEASDMLLYASLVEAAPYLKDLEVMDDWKELLRQGLVDLEALTEAERFPDGDLSIQAV